MEIEGPHQHHHGHGTGHRWLDISLALCAFFVSLVSLWLGIHSAQTMEKLVASNSYPNIDNWRSKWTPSLDKGTVHFELVNTGVGPARLEWVAMSYQDKPMRDLAALLAACCDATPEAAEGLLSSGSFEGSLIPAGKPMRILTWDQPAIDNPVWKRLHGSMNQIVFSSCYCSVFDECYVRTPDKARPQSVKACVAPEVPFHAGVLKASS